MQAADLEVRELLDFAPDEGRISFRDHRMLLWNADAFGNLRKELFDALGIEASSGILRRFGFANGYRDALSIREAFHAVSDRDWWLTCPALQGHQGKVAATVKAFEIDREAGHFELEVEWRNSYEAAQHRRISDVPTAPICWTLAGYASGFASAVMGTETFAVEQQCVAKGDPVCRVVGKTRRGWGEAGERIANEYRARSLVRELEERDEELRRATRQLETADRALRALGVGETAGMVARSAEMRRVTELVAKVAPSEATVLITGESGVGKERVARALHEGSPRSRGGFVALNCAALPEALLESELFGHVRGAFTGAISDKQGLFAAARGGTLFLDELGEMSLATQAKLLRVLQEREVRPVGATASLPVDVRVVAATNRDPAELVAQHRFRQDLYYRLDVIRIDVPPLRARREDILPLARHFIESMCRARGMATKTLSPDAAHRLCLHPWPGNVRELENAIEHALVLAGSEAKLATQHLPPALGSARKSHVIALLEDSISLHELERRYTLAVLERNGGGRAATARALGIATNTLWRKLKAWGVAVAKG
ncbi:MAG: sigma 54-interacting transcriptional regulator [Deltaproteobacteria bacterium]|nr:sigma 54-interacting transcriptional regulator [Deltaproteobacteria bacterium]